MRPHGLRLAAPAKINLHLRVGGPRADGFHPVLTWMVTVGLFDNLILEPSHGPESPDAAFVGGGGGPAVRLSCDLPELPCDSCNLVVRAAEALRHALLADDGATPGSIAPPADQSCGGLRAPGSAGPLCGPEGGEGQKRRDASGVNPSVGHVDIRLLKRIPIGAGLGGGSSDAARALAGLGQLWGASWPAAKLASLAAKLGSDLPFFLYGSSAICRGRGELVQPLSPPRARFALLIIPSRPMPTPAVYRRLDELRPMKVAAPPSVEVEPDFRAWSDLGTGELLPLLVNDLEPAAFSIDPELGRLRGSVEEALSRIVRMSGSGSTLFTLFDAEESQQARDAAVAVQTAHGVRCVIAEIAPKVEDDLTRRC